MPVIQGGVPVGWFEKATEADHVDSPSVFPIETLTGEDEQAACDDRMGIESLVINSLHCKEFFLLNWPCFDPKKGN